MRSNTYVYVYVNGKALGFTDDWMDTSGYGKDFITFGGGDFFACEAWKVASADTAEEAAALLTEWLAVKGLHVGAPMVCTGMPPEFPAAHGNWTRESVKDIVFDTLRKMGLPEEDLNGREMRWVVSRYPLSVDFDTHEGVEGKRLHGEHYFPVLGSMTEKDIRRRVRDWAHSLRGHWKEEGPISAYGRRMVEKFPATYRAFERAAPSKTQECGVAPPVTLSKEANSMQKPPVDDFISMPEAVELSGYSRRQIVRLCANGDLPSARKLGNRWLVPRQELRDYTPGPKGPVPGKKK